MFWASCDLWSFWALEGESETILTSTWSLSKWRGFPGHTAFPLPSQKCIWFLGVEKKRIDSNKNVFVWEKLFPSMSKHIVWGKFMALAWSLISGCQKVLVWTKICCNKNALFWRNLLSPWKPIQFRKICWFQWKSICFKRQREGSCTQLRTRGFSQYRSPCSPLAIRMGKAGKSTSGQQRKPVGLSCAQWPSSQLKKSAPAPLGQGVGGGCLHSSWIGWLLPQTALLTLQN